MTFTPFSRHKSSKENTERKTSAAQGASISFTGVKLTERTDSTVYKHLDVNDINYEETGLQTSDTLSLARIDQDGSDLWQQAWESVEPQFSKFGFDRLKSKNTKIEVKKVIEITRERSLMAENSHRKIPGTERTFREVYGKIANVARKFEAVGDLAAQIEPAYFSIPWACVKLVIELSAKEQDTYDLMIGGSELVVDVISRYPIMEQTYARLDSDLSSVLRRSLLGLYKAVLEFQAHAYKYFDPNHKLTRTLRGINPVKSGELQDKRDSISAAALQVDRDIGLVNAHVTKVGIDKLTASSSEQNEQLSQLKERMKAMSGEAKGAEVWQNEQMKAIIDLCKDHMDNIKSDLEQRIIEKQKANLKSVRQWLSKAQPETDFSQAKGKRQMLLGEWLFNNEKFKNWEDSEVSAMLWLHGFAGTGKTALICRSLDHFRERASTTEGGQHSTRIGFFFFSGNEAGKADGSAIQSDPEEALRSLVSQVSTSEQNRMVEAVVQEKYNELGPNSDKHRPLTAEECWDILNTISRHSKIIIALDALDEADRTRGAELVQNLEVLGRVTKNVKILCSTRSFPAIEDMLAKKSSLEITAELNGQDVKDFIANTLENKINSTNTGQIPQKLKDEIKNTLSKQAGSMFIYAVLVLGRLFDRNRHNNEQSIRKKLKEMPTDLKQVYDAVLGEIHDKENSERSCFIAQSTFQWLLYAQNTLNINSILEAIDVPGGMVTIDEVIRACRTLVRQVGTKLEFTHYSVREHIKQVVNYSSSKCHLMATKSCLKKLNSMFSAEIRRTEPAASKPTAFESTASEQPFEQYAVLYWPTHIEGINREDRQKHRNEINEMLRTFLFESRGQKSKFQGWLNQVKTIFVTDKGKGEEFKKLKTLESSAPSALFTASVFGLEDLIGRFGRELNGLNRYNEQGQSALCLAIENNKLDTVKAMLRSRFPADINLLNIKAVQQFDEWNVDETPNVILYASPLQCAAACGFLEITEYLIEQGAHVDLVAGYYGSPLQAAALGGHYRVVELLLQHGAEPNSQCGFHGNALQAAAAGAHTQVVNLLLDNRPPALVNVPGGYYGSAILAAIHSGQSEIVYNLLEERADPNVKSRIHGTPLEEAMAISSREMTRDLLSFKATIDVSRGDEPIYALYEAVIRNLPELVEHCLSQCTVDMIVAKDHSNYRKSGGLLDVMTPLAFACEKGHLEIAEMLLHYEIPSPVMDPSYVLWIATINGHAEVMKLLIEHFKKQYPHGSLSVLFDYCPEHTPYSMMCTAASSSNPDAVSVLISNGCPYKPSLDNVTPLMVAATNTAPSVTQRILDYHIQNKVDAQIDKKADNGYTALLEACENGNVPVFGLLLDAGTDITISGGKFDRTCLIICAMHDNYELTSLILRRIETMSE